MEGNGKLWRKDGEIEAAWDLPAGYMLGRAVYKVRRRVTFWEGNFIVTRTSYTLQMTIDIAVGVLALQGAFYEHVELLRQAATEVALNDGQRWEFVEVRTTQELERCEGLIIPGGESTSVSLVAARSNMLEPLRDFVKYVHEPQLHYHNLVADFVFKEYAENQHGGPAPD